MKEVNKVLGSLMGSIIKSLDFNLEKCQIVFSLDAHMTEDIIQHSVVFDKVSVFYFINGDTHSRKDCKIIGEGDYVNGYLEFTYAETIDEVNIVPKSEHSAAQFMNSLGKANIFVEIWSTLLLIEAEVVVIDGIEYRLPETH